MSAETELYRAVIAAIKNDATLDAAVGGRVVDWPDANIAFPCISVQSPEMEPLDCTGTEAHVATVTITVWSRGTRATLEARDIGDKLFAALHRRPSVFVTPNHTVVAATRVYSTTYRDDASSSELNSTVARHVARFRFIIEANVMRAGVI